MPDYIEERNTTNKCIKYVSTEFPSTIYFHPNQFLSIPAAFQLILFSTENCEYDQDVGQVPIDLKVPFQFNDRTPIGSFKLGKSPTPEPPTTVVFNNIKGQNTTFVVNTIDCETLYDDEYETHYIQYPLSVSIYQGNGSNVDANNFLQLFADGICSGDPLVKKNKKSSEIRSGDELLDLTDKPNEKLLLIRSLSVEYFTDY